MRKSRAEQNCPPGLGSLRVRFAFADQSAYGGSVPLAALAPTARSRAPAAPSLLNESPRRKPRGCPGGETLHVFPSAHASGFQTMRRGLAPTVEPASFTSGAIFTRTPGIVPLFAWRASACRSEPDGPERQPDGRRLIANRPRSAAAIDSKVVAETAPATSDVYGIAVASPPDRLASDCRTVPEMPSATDRTPPSPDSTCNMPPGSRDRGLSEVSSGEAPRPAPRLV